MKTKNQIPISNYVKLIIIMCVTMIIVIILRNIYIQDKLYKDNEPLIRKYLVSEVNNNEIYSYIRENENTLIYICASDDDKCYNFEKEFGPIIEKRELANDITYLNITNVSKKSEFIKEFNKFYGSELLGYPSLVIFNDGKVKDILTVKDSDKLDIKSVEEFLNKNKVSSGFYD